MLFQASFHHSIPSFVQITIIISYYKAFENLQLILASLSVQSVQQFEVIISEDDYNENTIEFVRQVGNKYPFPIYHIHQQSDNGFRKNEMLNRAIQLAHTPKLVFIDGDCVPHRHFVKQYLQAMKEGYIMEGRAVMLGEKTSKEALKRQSVQHLRYITLLFSDAEKTKEGLYFPWAVLSFAAKGRGLVGRNWGICKQHLMAVNGFDADYVYAGVGEDVDIEWRLKANGIQTLSMKNKAIVYHIYHAKGYSEEKVKENFAMMYRKQKENHIRCLNGIERLG